VAVLAQDKFGFKRGIGNRDEVGMLRILREQFLDMEEEVCACFID
jgi:hypothetical protein